MLKIFLITNLFIGSAAFAGAESIKAPLKPVSVSYEGLLHCYPDLAEPKFMSQVDMDKLKDSIDQKFPTTSSLLRYRKVRSKKDNGDIQFVTLGLKTENPKTYELRLEKLDSKEGPKIVPLSQAQRSNPTPKLVDVYLLDSTVQVDDSAFEDSKTKGLVFSYVRSLKGVSQLELKDKAQKKSLTCTQESDLGPVCSCTKN